MFFLLIQLNSWHFKFPMPLILNGIFWVFPSFAYWQAAKKRILHRASCSQFFLWQYYPRNMPKTESMWIIRCIITWITRCILSIQRYVTKLLSYFFCPPFCPSWFPFVNCLKNKLQWKGRRRFFLFQITDLNVVFIGGEFSFPNHCSLSSPCVTSCSKVVYFR